MAKSVDEILKDTFLQGRTKPLGSGLEVVTQAKSELLKAVVGAYPKRKYYDYEPLARDYKAAIKKLFEEEI